MKTINITTARRTLITFIILTFCFIASMQAQEVKNEPKYKLVGNEIVSITAEKTKVEPVATSYTYKGKIVYRGSKGGLFVYMTAKKSGKIYKKYLKL